MARVKEMRLYAYLVVNKANDHRYVMVGNLKNCNMGSGKYLYELVGEDYEYAMNSPYGFINNVSTGIKYNSRQYKIVHQMEMPYRGLEKEMAERVKIKKINKALNGMGSRFRAIDSRTIGRKIDGNWIVKGFDTSEELMEHLDEIAKIQFVQI